MKKSKPWFIYVLKCANGSFYTGSTTNVSRRLLEHQSGRGAKYTRGRLPVLYFHSGPFESRGLALRAENLIKRQSREWKSRIDEVQLMEAVLSGKLKSTRA